MSTEQPSRQKIDLHAKKSSHKGLKGVFETLMRSFAPIMHMFLILPLYLIASIFLGICLLPGISLFRFISTELSAEPQWVQNLSFGVSIVFGYFMYGFSLLLVAPLANFLLNARLKEWRGPYYSLEMIKWYIHNGLTILVRFTFLEFVTPSPMSILYYRLMGMRIGQGTIINTTHIADPSLVELGDKVTLGGSVGILAHYGQGGLMVISPVKIGNKCTIGLKATIMGGCIIGDEAKVLPHSVVMPKTIIPPGETWGGVPAKKID